MENWIKAFAFARRVAEAIVEGRIEAAQAAKMSDEELAEFDTEAYAALVAAQAENEALAKPVE